MDRPGIPICVVTGFLGAGKTTLLNHILRNQSGLRAAVFVNEFGATEIDSTLIRMHSSIDEDRIITLDNGCICCEINEDLANQLQAVLAAQAGMVDFIVIETSGVCDPLPVLSTLENLDSLAYKTHLDCVIAVVDAQTLTPQSVPSIAHKLGLEDTAKAQICSSDIVLLNKCDLLEGGFKGKVAADILTNLQQKLRSAAAHLSRRAPRVLQT
eukprot:4450575-Amphidinium_carterae.1